MTTVEVGNSHTMCLETKRSRSVTFLQAFLQKISKYIFRVLFSSELEIFININAK